MEKFPIKPDSSLEEPKKETSKRLLLALESIRLNFSKIEVGGEDHLQEIPPGAKVVVVADHLNNLSIPLTALIIGHKLPIVIANQSTQFPLFGKGHIGVMVGGKDNFKGIDYDEKTSKPKSFNSENFTSMLESMDEGYAVVMAAHNPADTEELPDETGYGAAYLAGIAGAYILPIAVNIKSKEGVHIAESNASAMQNIKNSLGLLIERPEAEVGIGHPHTLPDEEDIKKFHEMLTKRKSGAKLSAEEFDEFKHLRQSLNNAAGSIMKEISSMLPEDKRGSWQQESQNKSK